MIYIIAIGKVNASYYLSAISEYVKRISAYSKLSIVELDECRLNDESDKEIKRVIDTEGKSILKTKGYVIALDKDGGELTSEGLAELISIKYREGISDISFIIGGSYGLSQEVKDRADRIISFGKFTYPHQLMRVILIEQIYRAFSIINNSKYHK